MASFADDFNRANGTLTTPWVVSGMASSVLGVIDSNHAAPSGLAAVNYMKYNTPADTDSCYSRIDATVVTTQSQYGEINALLVDGTGNNYQFCWAIEANAGQYILYRNTSAASGTTIGTAVAGPASGTVNMWIERTASAIRCFADGSQIFSVTDATFTTRYPGFGLYVDAGTAANFQVDNFFGGDSVRPKLVAPGGAVHRASRW